MALFETLGNGLVLRSVDGESDIRRFAAFNATYNNAGEGLTCDCLLRHHPETTLADYWLVEDQGTGEIVSTICLLPWRCRYAQVELRVAMLEMVLTHPAYRGQGLVRMQIKHFLQAVQARGFDLGIIWGIPYYYRQYGYGYCLDGDVYEALPARQIPGSVPGQPFPYHLRMAGVEDIPGLCQLYNQSTASLQVHVLRDPAYWEYLLCWAGFPVQVLEHEPSGELAGYAAFTRSADGQKVRILESAIPRAELGLDLLRRLYTEDLREILIAWPQSGTLAALARSLGSRVLPGGQWLLRIPDMARFIQKIGPVLEERLAASTWQGLSMDFVLNFYRQAFKLRFNAGKLAGVQPLGFVDTSMGADGGHCCIPPEAFLRLAFGYRSLDELRDAWPDVVTQPQVRSLVDVMFPPMISYLTTPYHTMKTS